MKKIKYSLLASLLAVTFVAAETNTTFDGITPPNPDISLLEGDACDPAEVQASIDEAVLIATAQAKELQKLECKNDPQSCGIVIPTLPSAVEVSELGTGWHLLGTSMDINDTADLSSAKIVWSFHADKWSAYSSDSITADTITDTSSIDTLSRISANSGFWILK